MAFSLKNFTGILDDPLSYHTLDKDKRDSLIAHYFFNKFKGRSRFTARCLSGANEAEQLANPSGSMDTYYPIKVRIEEVHGGILLDPCSEGWKQSLKNGGFPEDQWEMMTKKQIALHFTAEAKNPLIAGERTPGFGEEIEVEFTSATPSKDGKMRGLQYTYPKQGVTYDYKCAMEFLQPLVGKFINGPALLGGGGYGGGPGAEVPQFDAKNIPSKDYNTQLVPAVPYKENRVTLKHFGSMPCSSPQIVDVGAPSSKKAHVLVVKRFKLLQEAFIKETGMEPLKVTSACRPHRWTSRAQYEAKMIKNYGSVAEGRKWVAFASPHESGLALDMTHPAKPRLEVSSKAAKAGRLQKSPAFLWLKANAHRWGFTPYKREPWHWELKVPYESWRTGQEFVTDGNYAVRVIETKK